MKTTLTAISIFSLSCLVPVYAQVTETTEETTQTKSAAGTVTESKTSTTTTFNPEVRTGVVKYFETYKTNPHGLPPEWATKIKAKELPSAWRTTRISPGVVVSEKERAYLMEAPPELVKVLPPPTAEVRYYVAGSNVVAVNKRYEVVDSIQIPSLKFEVEAE